jgi:hypothetical protein
METICFTTPKARKEHSCDWCGGKIKIGEKYTRAFCKEDDVYVWKNHIRCEQIANHLKMFEDGALTESDFVENIEGYYSKIMNENYNEIYESEEFKYPDFKGQLDFVCSFYKITNDFTQ